jgi:TatD DNase family protein
MKYTDSHCHLDFEAFSSVQSNLPNSLLAQCMEQHIHQIIIPAIAPNNWQNVLALANSKQALNNQQCKIFVCLGIHPWFLDNLEQRHLALLTEKVVENRANIIAIGEMGLDGVIAKQQNNINKQLEFFEYQLQLAKQQQLPVIVHHRGTHNETITLLKQVKVPRAGIIHAFSGSYQQACQYIDLGFKLGIGGTITYPRAKKTINAIKRLPLSSLVLETDAPAMPLYGFQGEDNSPLRLINIFEQLVLLREEKPEVIAETIENNISALFNLPLSQ